MNAGKIKMLSALLLVFVAFLVLANVAAALPIENVKVEIDDVELEEDQVNRLDIERGNEVKLKVIFNSTADLEDVELMAFISGYEYNDRERMSDIVHIYDMENGVTYVKTLRFTVPSKVEEDNYKLRLVVSDRYGDENVYRYNLKIDVPRHSVVIKDVIFSPENIVKAGRAFIVRVRVANMGEKTEEGVKVYASIPALGISASDYIDELDTEEEKREDDDARTAKTSEELYMRIPECAEPGEYTVKVRIEYDEGYEEDEETYTIRVLPGEGCEVPGEEPKVEEQTIINVGTSSQEIVAGEAGAVYPITITNQGTTSRVYMLDVDGVADWATVKISPTNVLSVGAGETKTAYVYVSAKESASAGEHLFVVTVSDASGKSLQDINLKATVKAAEKPGYGFRFDWARIEGGLKVTLIVLVVLLIIIALIIGFNRLRGAEEEEKEGSQTYY